MLLWNINKIVFCLPGQLSVLWNCLACQALRQRQRLLSAGSDVVKALRQEDHAGPPLLGIRHQLLTSREVGRFVWGGCHLTHCGHWARWSGHPAQTKGCRNIQGTEAARHGWSLTALRLHPLRSYKVMGTFKSSSFKCNKMHFMHTPISIL